ncbi:conserved protein, unknown function, partial [Hepatocystis sp. ex Piliocolobus tephrosceles]
KKYRYKNVKLKKETELKKCLDYLKKHQWERCISYLHTSIFLINKDTDFYLEYESSNNILEDLLNDCLFLEYKDKTNYNKNIYDRTIFEKANYIKADYENIGYEKNGFEKNGYSNVPLLLPLDVFNLPSSFDMYDSYYKSYTYCSTDENNDSSIIKFIDTSQNKFDTICDYQKCENSNIYIEDSIDINHMYSNFTSSYFVYHSLFNENMEDVSFVDQHQIQS